MCEIDKINEAKMEIYHNAIAMGFNPSMDEIITIEKGDETAVMYNPVVFNWDNVPRYAMEIEEIEESMFFKRRRFACHIPGFLKIIKDGKFIEDCVKHVQRTIDAADLDMMDRVMDMVKYNNRQ